MNYYNVSFKYSETVYCSNLVKANEEATTETTEQKKYRVTFDSLFEGEWLSDYLDNNGDGFTEYEADYIVEDFNSRGHGLDFDTRNAEKVEM